MGKWITREERQELTPAQCQELRKARKLAHWPDTDGKPPWLVKLGETLEDIGKVLGVFAQRAAMVLVRASFDAVKAAAISTIEGGEARHEFAVDRLMEAAAESAEPILREQARGLIVDAFDVLDEAGELDG